MVQIRDEVREARMKKAHEWFAAAAASATIPKGWNVDELVLASAIGYFVPKAFKSANGRNVTDAGVLELMMAQGYKPRAKKDSSSDSEDSRDIPASQQTIPASQKMDTTDSDKEAPEARSGPPEAPKKRKYTRKPKPNADAQTAPVQQPDTTTLVFCGIPANASNKDALVEAINNLSRVLAVMAATR